MAFAAALCLAIGIAVAGVARGTTTPGPTPKKNRTAATKSSPAASPARALQSTGTPTPVDGARFPSGACVAYPPSGHDRRLTVFLDAGHGGLDPGARGVTSAGTAIDERPLTLATTLDTVALLQARGYRVVVSRNRDTSVARLGASDVSGGILTVPGLFKDTAARAICADEAGAAVLVSVHFNAGSSASNAGMLTAYDNARPFSAQNLALATLLQSDVLASMNANGWAVPDDGVVSDAGTGAPGLSAAARAYGRLLILGPGDPGYFSTPSAMPGALVEPLFLSDPFEGSIAERTEGQQAIAAGIAKAVDTFLTSAR